MMANHKTGSRSTLADALDLTRWDFNPSEDQKVLLQPVGSVFAELPWEILPQYLGPAPVSDADQVNGDAEERSNADTQPIPPLEEG
jgi:hypothetical protein